MTELSMRVAKSLSKRNLTNNHIKNEIESVAQVVDEVLHLPLICEVLSRMDGLSLLKNATDTQGQSYECGMEISDSE